MICSYIPQRFIVIFLNFGAVLLSYLAKNVYYFTMEEIVAFGDFTETFNYSVCPMMHDSLSDHDYVKDELFWSDTLVQAVHQTYNIGYLVFLLPAGVLADHLGAKGLLGVGILVLSLNTLLTPVLTLQGHKILMLGRFTEGVTRALIHPASNVIVAQWVPITERATASAVTISGDFIGLWLSVVLCKICHETWSSWHLPYYLTAALGLIWLLPWYYFIYDEPSQSPYITEEEVLMIHQRTQGINRKSKRRKWPFFVPWRQLLTSPAVLSMLLLNWAATWVHFLLMNEMEEYFATVVRITTHMNEILTLFTETIVAASAILWGIVGDWLVNHDYMSITTSRSFFGFSSNMLLIPFLLGMLLVGCNQMAAVMLYAALSFCRGPFYSVFRANFVDLAPMYAGVVRGLVSTTGAVAALVQWELSASILTDPSDISNWWTLYLLTAVFLVMMSLPYLWLGSAEVQPWNYARPRRRTEVRTTESAPSTSQ